MPCLPSAPPHTLTHALHAHTGTAGIITGYQGSKCECPGQPGYDAECVEGLSGEANTLSLFNGEPACLLWHRGNCAHAPLLTRTMRASLAACP